VEVRWLYTKDIATGGSLKLRGNFSYQLSLHPSTWQANVPVVDQLTIQSLTLNGLDIGGNALADIASRFSSTSPSSPLVPQLALELVGWLQGRGTGASSTASPSSVPSAPSVPSLTATPSTPPSPQPLPPLPEPAEGGTVAWSEAAEKGLARLVMTLHADMPSIVSSTLAKGFLAPTIELKGQLGEPVAAGREAYFRVMNWFIGAASRLLRQGLLAQDAPPAYSILFTSQGHVQVDWALTLQVNPPLNGPSLPLKIEASYLFVLDHSAKDPAELVFEHRVLEVSVNGQPSLARAVEWVREIQQGGSSGVLRGMDIPPTWLINWVMSYTSTMAPSGGSSIVSSQTHPSIPSPTAPMPFTFPLIPP